MKSFFPNYFLRRAISEFGVHNTTTKAIQAIYDAGQAGLIEEVHADKAIRALFWQQWDADEAARNREQEYEPEDEDY